jgi:hypothetical protein
MLLWGLVLRTGLLFWFAHRPAAVHVDRITLFFCGSGIRLWQLADPSQLMIVALLLCVLAKTRIVFTR